MNRQVTLYVKSEKIKVQKEHVARNLAWTWTVPPPWGTGDTSSTYEYFDAENVDQYDYVLPEDQRKMAGHVKELGQRYGFDVEVVDLAKKNPMSRFRLEHSGKIRAIPSVLTDSGEIAEGIITKDKLENLFVKAAKATWRKPMVET